MRRRSPKFVLSASWGLFLLSSAVALAASGTRNEPFPTARANGAAGQLLDKPMRPFASPYQPTAQLQAAQTLKQVAVLQIPKSFRHTGGLFPCRPIPAACMVETSCPAQGAGLQLSVLKDHLSIDPSTHGPAG